MQNNVLEAKKALTAKSIKVTSFERIQIMNTLRDKYAHLPQQLRFGNVLKDFLTLVSTPVRENDLIIGRYVEKEVNEQEDEECKAFFADWNVYKTTVFSCGHRTLDWERLVNLGLVGIREDVSEKLDKVSEAEEQNFLSGAILVLDGIIAFIERYADECEKNGMTAQREVLRAIANRAPQTFYEALQLCWIVAFIDCAYVTGNPTLTLGRMDRFLNTYYENDVKNGFLTREKAKDLITDYYCKHNLIMGVGEHQIGDESNSTGFDRILNFDAPQYLLLAGTDEQGEDGVTELTYLFAECIQPSFKNPVIVVRYYKGLNEKHPKLWQTLSAKALASSSMMIYNDDDIISAFIKQGVTEKDARNYGHFGCNWADLGHDSLITYMGPNAFTMARTLPKDERNKIERYNIGKVRYSSPLGYPEEFMNVFGEVISEGGAQSIDVFYDKFARKFSEFLEYKFKFAKEEIELRKKFGANVLTLGDVLSARSIEKVSATCADGVKYHVEVSGFVGFATVADCFTVVEKLCFIDKSVTLERLYEATVNDFIGYDDVLEKIESVEKFGSGEERSTANAKRLALLVGEYVSKINRQNEGSGIIIMPSIQSDTWHIKHGKNMGATPDGRRKGEPYSQNVNPAPRRSVNGRVAMLDSLSALPFDYFTSGALNFDVQPDHFKGKDGLENFANLIGTYLNSGGLHLQINAVGKEDLIKAKDEPEKYKDLRVRVTGYTGIFVDFPENLQDDIINRMD
ncbi:MAG: hypothetical protein J6C23_00880 [Clostridia bacterium]|nr:hypothetical protein [Clostridia bacterium]